MIYWFKNYIKNFFFKTEICIYDTERQMSNFGIQKPKKNPIVNSNTIEKYWTICIQMLSLELFTSPVMRNINTWADNSWAKYIDDAGVLELT